MTMRTNVAIGGSAEMSLTHAVLIYRDHSSGHATFASVHPVLSANKGAPRLAAGTPVDQAFVNALADELGARVPTEVLPPNIICRTAEMIAWWSPAHVRTLFFRSKSDLACVSGMRFTIPPLVWKLTGSHLAVRALPTNARPSARTPLAVAPFWNTYAGDGGICQGSMRRPENVTAENAADWEHAYFEAGFTHAVPGKKPLTRIQGGVQNLWKALAVNSDKHAKPFPLDSLVPAEKTLLEFLKPKKDRAGDEDAQD